MLMLDFMNNRKCNAYHLTERISDCEASLTMFNYVTPMAVCVEAILKITGLDLDLDYTDEKLDRIDLFDLLRNQKIKTELGKWGVDQNLINQIDSYIRDKNNNYKHSFLNVRKPTPAEKLTCFKVLYRFLSIYYEHCTGKEAPVWDADKYQTLFTQEIDDYSARLAAAQLR